MSIALHIANIIVVAFGAPAFCLAMCESRAYQRVGAVLGVASTPAWWVIVVESQQWSMYVMQILFTVGWFIKLRSVMKS